MDGSRGDGDGDVEADVDADVEEECVSDESAPRTWFSDRRAVPPSLPAAVRCVVAAAGMVAMAAALSGCGAVAAAA